MVRQDIFSVRIFRDIAPDSRHTLYILSALHLSGFIFQEYFSNKTGTLTACV